jgi:hypothetical protein
MCIKTFLFTLIDNARTGWCFEKKKKFLLFISSDTFPSTICSIHILLKTVRNWSFTEAHDANICLIIFKHTRILQVRPFSETAP